MPLGIGSGFFAIAMPVEKTNLLLNPSFEFGTTGVAAIQSSTIGSSSGFQQFGAWSCSVTPNSNGTSGGAFGTWTAGNGTAYTVSAYVRGANGVPYMIGVGDSAGLNLLGSTAFTGGGTWQRHSFSYTEASGAVRRVVIRKTSGADTTLFYVDGQQAEVGSITTYLDGDIGGTWSGAPHNSTSTRSGQDRSGGSVVALADLGWNVDQMPGVGMPPMENSSQSYAIVDGAQYQRTRAGARSFTLTAKPIVGTTTQDYHITRRTIIDALKIDAVTPQQPSRFYYVGGQGTVQINALYDHGLELGNMDGPIAEDIAVSFQAYDPYFYAPTQQGTAVPARTAIGSTNFIVKRSPSGVWGTLGQANGSTFQDGAFPAIVTVNALGVTAGGTVVVGGYFSTVSGTWSQMAALYFPITNTFGSLTGGTLGGNVGDALQAIAPAPSGSVFLAGDFVTAGGTTFPNICQWNGAFGTLTGGTVDNLIRDVAINALGTVFICGDFSLAGGSTARRLAQWANGSWGTISQTAGTLDANVVAITIGLDQSLYLGGNFGSAGGTAAVRVARWNGSYGTLSTGVAGGNAVVVAMATKPDGRIVAGGDFLTMGGVTVNSLAEWNGAGWSQAGAGVAGRVSALGIRADNSYLLSGSWTSAGGITTPDSAAIWTGATYLPLGIDLPGQPNINAILETSDTTVYLGGLFSGTAQAAQSFAVVNAGRAQAYPTLRMRNLSSGTARAFHLINFTTGAALYFNLPLISGEMVTLTLAPGARSFTSSFRGNVFGGIMPGSNLTTWSLLSGTNNLSFFGDNDSLEVSLYWQASSWSIDGGTIF